MKTIEPMSDPLGVDSESELNRIILPSINANASQRNFDASAYEKGPFKTNASLRKNSTKDI